MVRLTRALCAALALMTAAGLCRRRRVCELKRVYNWDTAVTLTGYVWADGVSGKDVSLAEALPVWLWSAWNG